jgi:hypothetical protein
MKLKIPEINKVCLFVWCLGFALVSRFVHEVCTGLAMVPGTQGAWSVRKEDI